MLSCLTFKGGNHTQVPSKAETVSFWLYISLHCDRDTEDCNPCFSHDIPAHNNISPYHIWFLKVEHFWQYCPDKHDFYWTNWSVLFYACSQQGDITPIRHPPDTLAYSDLPPKFGCKGIINSEVIVVTSNSHILIIYKPSLWPWSWRQQQNPSALHFVPRWSTTIPSLVAKGWAVHSPHCDLDLQDSIFSPQDTPSHGDAPQY